MKRVMQEELRRRNLITIRLSDSEMKVVVDLAWNQRRRPDKGSHIRFFEIGIQHSTGSGGSSASPVSPADSNAGGVNYLNKKRHGGQPCRGMVEQ